ncbi:MAG: glycine--tRNA ligase [Desulfurococcaceae archaeon]
MRESINDTYEKILELSRRRGLFWTSFEIYGGVAGFYDFGPIGVMIKRNIASYWLKHFVYSRENIVEIETPIINPRVVFKASGHEEHFTDPVLECENCKRIFRADHLIKDLLGVEVEGWSLEEITRLVRERGLKCPECGGGFREAFNTLLLFSTNIGPYKGEIGYLRPEHAQGMFINFPQVFRVARSVLPLGIAQIGKVARNEISPRQGLIRLREFTIMEIEFFFDPEEAEKEALKLIEKDGIKDEKILVLTSDMRYAKIEQPVEYTVEELVKKNIVRTPWLAYWMGIGNQFIRNLGVPPDRVRFVEKLPHERAHYSAQTFDQEVYAGRFGWVEVAGYAYRTDYDIQKHAEYSGFDFTVFKRYEKPVSTTIRKVLPNPVYIEKIVGREKLGEVMKKISSISTEEITRGLETKGYVEIDRFKLLPECFTIKEEEVKIHGKKIYPHVVEPSFGLERLLYVVLEYAYTEREDKTTLRIPPQIAPYHVAVFPLMTGRRPEHVKMVEIAKDIYKELTRLGFRVYYDEEGSIGRRYARADEIGTPYAITVDHQTIMDNTVTIRDRDTTLQIRIGIHEVVKYLLNALGIHDVI